MHERNFFKSRASEEQLSLIAGNLAQLYKSGIPITTALELVSDISYNKIYKECEHPEKQKEENGECLLILYGECEVVDDER